MLYVGWDGMDGWMGWLSQVVGHCRDGDFDFDFESKWVGEPEQVVGAY